MDPTTQPVDAEAVDPTPAPPKRSRRLLKLTLAVVGTVVLVGVPSAVALIIALNRGTGDQLTRLVPANTDVYVTAMLDPSLSQKRNLQSVLARFPELHSPQDIQKHLDDGLDSTLKSLGIDFRHDVQPWLGSQIAVVADISPTQFALLLRTNDEKSARAMLDKVKAGPEGDKLSWSTGSHGGVSTASGVMPSDQPQDNDMAYAVFDHTAVLANGVALLDKVIDADQGRTGNLTTVAGYKQTLQDLPSDNVLVAYVNAPPLVDALRKPLQQYLDNAPQAIRDSLASLDAYQSFGATLSLQQNAVAFDTVLRTDPSKLPASERSALSAPSQSSTMLSWIPQDSYALVASSGRTGAGGALQGTAVAVIAALTVIGEQTSSASPSTTFGNGLYQPPPQGFTEETTPTPAPSSDTVDKLLDQLGITGDDGVLAHLTGESALYVTPGGAHFPFDAVAVVGTDDPGGMDSTLHKLGDLLGPDGQGAPWKDQQDGGVTIHYLDLPADAGVLPAYAMVGNDAVIGTTPSAVRHAIDAHNGTESTITSQPAFHSATAGQSTASVTFLDLQRTIGVIESNLSDSDRADFDKNTAPSLKRLRTFTVTGSGDVHHQTSHMVLTLG